MSALPDVTALIAAAGLVPEGFVGLANIGSPAMIPVSGRPVIYWTLSTLRELGVTRFVVAVRERGGFVEDFLRCTFGRTCQIDFIVPDRDQGVGYTIACLARAAETPQSLIVLGDTSFKPPPEARLDDASSWVLASPVHESYRWCMVRADAEGRIAQLTDKPDSWDGPMEALIGVYKLGDTAELRRAADAAVATGTKSVQISQILDRYRAAEPIAVLPAAEWLDCGNPDNQARAHRKLLARVFNHIEIDETFAVLTKESREAKFRDEIRYFELLPRELSVLFPRIIESDRESEPARIVMEYYGYPNIAEMFIYENLNLAHWDQMFAHLLALMETGFMQFPGELRRADLEAMYLGKPRQRIEAAARQDNPDLRTLSAAADLTINGRAMRNLGRLWPDIERAVASFAIDEHYTVIHGDLCFSNILYDVRSRICKLLDPRGSFGTPGIYGDIKYDVAKLYHSVRGHYDFLVNDLFDLDVRGTTVDLATAVRPHHLRIGDRFDQIFFKVFDPRMIKVATGLLFVSMPALHYDHPRRQVAMYVRGVELLNEALS